MANENKPLEHIIHGSFPADEWEKFLKAHFKPGKPATVPQISRGGGGSGGETCTSLGCPSTHPISGDPLTGCSTVIERDGSVSIHCYYGTTTRR